MSNHQFLLIIEMLYKIARLIILSTTASNERELRKTINHTDAIYREAGDLIAGEAIGENDAGNSSPAHNTSGGG